MKTHHLTILLTAALCLPAVCTAATLAELEKAAAGNPSLANREALAEGYLRECELERSLAAWRRILADHPDHARAKAVVEKLTLQALDLDTQLGVLEALIDRRATDGAADLLQAAARRAATDGQKARILFLQGRLAETARPRPVLEFTIEAPRPKSSSMPARPSRHDLPPAAPAAVAKYLAAWQLYPNTEWGARAAMALARLHPGEEARQRLAEAGRNDKLPAGVREEATLALVLMNDAGGPAERRILHLRELAGRFQTLEGRRAALKALARAARAEGEWTSDAAEAAGAFLAADPPAGEAHAMLDALSTAARSSQQKAVLERIAAGLAAAQFDDPPLRHKAALALADAKLSLVVVEEDAATVTRLVEEAFAQVERVRAPGEPMLYPRRIRAIRDRMALVEPQKLVALDREEDALPKLMAARDYFVGMIAEDDDAALEGLEQVARLLVHMRQWQTAEAEFCAFARRFAETPAGRDALLQAARIRERELHDPLGALDLYAEYASRYPAELPYRQLDVGRRLKRLGYANVLDFQKSNGLEPDGVFGSGSRAMLRQVEAAFSRIRGPQGPEPILRGEFVHPRIHAIARRLHKAGRHHEAIGAYRMFLNLWPTKRESDDALISIARLLRDNLLFAEAIGAYEELIENYPKGSQTSLAYVEAAGCLENLGRWKEAGEYYELYLRNFPRYSHAELCRQRIEVLRELRQYAEFLRDNPDSPKRVEARYQTAAILYKKLKNYTKAAAEFEAVAAEFPRHVRAADALFSAGTSYLRAENFPAARRAFGALVANYPDSRLADDGQYWVGHTYEHRARALGKLDDLRIVLRRRGLRQREAILADMDLRRQYNPHAKPGEAADEDVWGGDTLGVLADGSVRDRVNADLFRAIAAYRQVPAQFKMADKAGDALLRVGVIYTKYLNDTAKGVEAYQQLLADYPATENAVDALYEVGAWQMENGKFEEAARAYRQFVFAYPRDNRVPEAMLSIARCHAEQKDWAKALDAYESYLSKFPRGEKADFAKAQVTWIRTYHY